VRKKSEPAWYTFCLRLMYAVNGVTAYLIFFMLIWKVLE
jgi:hypothetical protein